MIDLGSAPPSNAYLTERALHTGEVWVPLKVMVCESCWLAQTEDYLASDALFTDDYAYFSSASSSWLQHAATFVDDACRRFDLDGGSRVVEVAANDGYLLRFVQDRGIPCLGIEPTASTADAARQLGLEIVEEFLGLESAKDIVAQFGEADLLIANNVLAHVPDIGDFVLGLHCLLAHDGVLSVEFPRLTSLIDGAQFDTIYHEHYSYLSLTSVEAIFERHGLEVFDVEPIPTHGGSLRVYAQKAGSGQRHRTAAVLDVREFEEGRGIRSASYYTSLQARSESIKHGLLEFLLDCRRHGSSVAAYGAAAKGNTLLNFAGVRPDLLPFVVDRSPGKIGKYLPGSRIPILEEGELLEYRPDFILILPWNLQDEVTEQLSYTRSWGARFVTAVPQVSVT